MMPQWKAQQKTRELSTEFGRFQDWWRLFFGEKGKKRGCFSESAGKIKIVLFSGTPISRRIV